MKVSDYIGFIESEGHAFAAAAEQGPLDATIAPCPDWDMADLVRHLGMIHLWAAANVAFPEPDWLDVDELPDLVRYWPDLAGETGEYPPDDELVAWYRRTLGNLIDVLERAPADVEAFTFLPAPTPLTMWARRQASEIAIHRFDAESARGTTSHFDANFAADMLDELLSGFAPRPRRSALDVEREQRVHVHATDVDEHWVLAMAADGVQTSREAPVGDDIDLTASATAADLYVLFWNRAPDTSVELDGNADLMELWRTSCRVQWG